MYLDLDPQVQHKQLQLDKKKLCASLLMKAFYLIEIYVTAQQAESTCTKHCKWNMLIGQVDL